MVSKVDNELQMDHEQIEKYARRFLRRAYQMELIIQLLSIHD
ncbi:hypothetical protein [Bacillus sp. FJAT-22090]|nr:hypothetical protein [Bacillus sp. FJAT-22090]